MARIYTVKKARKDQGACESCGLPINAGDPYKWCAPGPPRMQRKRKRHAGCPTWRPSELTGSQHLATIYAAQEGFADEIAKATTVDDVATAMRDAADQVREAAESYRESAENIESGFGHPTSQSEELAEKADDVDAWADEIESRSDDLEGEADCNECGEGEDAGHHHGEFLRDPDEEPTTNDDGEVLCDECGETEDEHHEFDADVSSLDVSVVDDCPV